MANLIRREPYREMMSLRDAMDRLFEESFTRGFGDLGMPAMGTAMPVDVIDKQDEIVVEADLPGIKPEDLDVSISGNMLSLRAKTKTEREVKERNYQLQERRQGAFYRTIPLPTMVKAENAKAEFENGTLTLTLPKAEDVKAKSIQIKAKK